MSKFIFKLVATVEKMVEIEADNYADAEALANMTDMGCGYDSYSLDTDLLEERKEDCKYPIYVNGWNLVHPENLTYWKKRDNCCVAVCLFQLNENDNDSWIILKGIGDTVDEALEDLDIMPFTISDVGSRDTVEWMLLNWISLEV